MRGMSTGSAVGLAFLGLVAHALAVPVLLLILVSAAYGYADSIPGGGEVDSWDRMYKLGASPYVAFTGFLFLAVVDLVVTVGLLLIPMTRRWAWWAPGISIALSVLLLVAAILAFQPPPPDLGG